MRPLGVCTSVTKKILETMTRAELEKQREIIELRNYSKDQLKRATDISTGSLNCCLLPCCVESASQVRNVQLSPSQVREAGL